MEKLNIRIYDDEREYVEKWMAALEAVPAVMASCEVRGLDVEEFLKGLKSVETRREDARSEKSPHAVPIASKNCFDDADILIIDYDLLRVKRHRDLTGEEVAYLVRCFSQCHLIVALNQGYSPISNPFHLDLRPHPHSWADLNISSRQLGNPGLWGPWEKGMRPWYWPNLIRSARDFTKCVAAVNGLPSKARILETLGLDEDRLNAELPPTVLKPLVRGPAAPEALTFVELAKSRLRAKDRLWEPASANVAVAAVRCWLDRCLLPPQNVLVDAPHLIVRFPSLLPESSAEAANRTTHLDEEDLGIDLASVAAASYPYASWLSRPAWYWHRLKDLDLPENTDPWGSPNLEAVFCEDLSRFLPSAASRRYHSGLSSEFLYRWVADPSAPQAREVLAETRIDYDNDWLLAL